MEYGHGWPAWSCTVEFMKIHIGLKCQSTFHLLHYARDCVNVAYYDFARGDIILFHIFSITFQMSHWHLLEAFMFRNELKQKMSHFSYMEKRKPYDLKWLLAVYNLAQVVICCYIVYGFLSTEFSILQFWKCQKVDYRNNAKAIALVTYAYKTYLLKLLELVETVFFVMRKKQNQISKLHVYHHVSTAILAWIMVRYTAGKLFKHSLDSVLDNLLLGNCHVSRI